MKKINMSKAIFDYLTNICRSNKTEVSGSLKTNITDDVINVTEVLLADEEIEVRKKHSVDIDSDKFMTNILNYLNQGKKECYIHFHTHPPIINNCVPSKTDQKLIGGLQRLIDAFFRLMQKSGYNVSNDYQPKYIECIVHRKSLAFWYYDAMTNTFNKCDVLVNGKEYITKAEIPVSDSIIKSAIYGFKKGFKEGRR